MTTYAVTGATGFVGRALTRELRARGYHVRVLVRRYDDELTALGCHQILGDLTNDGSHIVELLRGVAGLFHVAAKVNMTGAREDFFAVNVEATARLIEACKELGVLKLVFTSSPSVVAREHSLRGVSEQIPYPKRFKAHYQRTKALAEGLVIFAGRSGMLATVALRPHLIFGPGDTGLTAAILGRARKGRLFRIGDCVNVVDFTYIFDCVAAHINSMEALERGDVGKGEVFFISQGDPFPFWEWVDAVLGIHGMPLPSRRVCRSMAQILGRIGDLLTAQPTLCCDPNSFASRLLVQVARRVAGIGEPVTSFIVEELTTDHYFSLAAARERLGYRPSFTIREALTHWETQIRGQ